MLNGKFFTGLPPKMIDRSGGLNRQQTNFFWPDDTQSQSAVETRVKRRDSLQAVNREAYAPTVAEQCNSDAETKERFKKEFTKSSIQFYDTVEQTPLRRNRLRPGHLPTPPTKQQNVEPTPDTSGRRKEVFSSKIEFYDYAEDLNNARRTDKNNKTEVERNTKNSPKLQNKCLSLDAPDETIHFIENDVRNMRIGVPPRRRNPPRQPRMPPREEPRGSDYCEDYDDYHPPPRRVPVLPPPPLRSRYSESDPDFDEYASRRAPVRRRKPPVYYSDFSADCVDAPPPSHLPLRFDDASMPPHRSIARQVHFTYSDNEHDYIPQHSQRPPTRKVNPPKVDNDVKNNEHQQPPPLPSPGGPSHKHLVSNICFSDTEPAAATPPTQPKRNIRSTAVNRVSVGLPD